MSKFWEIIKTPAIILAVLSAVGWIGKEFYVLINEKASAQAEIKVREKYDKVLTDYAILMATCGEDKH